MIPYTSAAVAVLVMALGLGQSPLVSCGTGGLIFIGTLLLIPNKKKIAPPVAMADTLMSKYQESDDKLQKIATYVAQIKEADVIAKINNIYSLGNDIVEHAEKDTTKLPYIRRFFTFYLDAIIEVLNKYTLAYHPKLNPESKQKLVNHLIATLDMIEKTFDSKLQTLLEQHVFEADMSMTTLQEMTKKFEGGEFK